MDNSFTHILWIGGSTDSGKTTLARSLADRHGLQVYHYDQHDAQQIETLSRNNPVYQNFLTSSLDQRWVDPTPEELAHRSQQSFRDRFPLVLKDLQTMPDHPMIIAEGFGFMPELIAPLLLHKRQACWIVPSDTFKLDSMKRRQKPSFFRQTRDPERAFDNLLARDRILTDQVVAQARALGLTVFISDGSRSIENMTDLLEGHFARYLEQV
jgi:hypothetical protein